MAYVIQGIGALLVDAFRTFATDPEVAEKAEVNRQRLDNLTNELVGIRASLTANDALDAEQTASLEAITAELVGIADVLTGPAGDPEDNGLIGEVDPNTEADESETANTAVIGIEEV